MTWGKEHSGLKACETQQLVSEFLLRTQWGREDGESRRAPGLRRRVSSGPGKQYVVQ